MVSLPVGWTLATFRVICSTQLLSWEEVRLTRYLQLLLGGRRMGRAVLRLLHLHRNQFFNCCKNKRKQAKQTQLVF